MPFYAGLTLDEIGGRGVRWPERDDVRLARRGSRSRSRCPPARPRLAAATLRLGTFRSLWAAKEVDVSPALHFVRARQVVELSPVDAAALGIREGDRVEVGSNGTRVRGPVRLRAAIPSGSVFLAEGTHEDASNVLTERLVAVRRVGSPNSEEAPAIAVASAPAVEGPAALPPPAPLPIPPRELT